LDALRLIREGENLNDHRGLSLNRPILGRQFLTLFAFSPNENTGDSADGYQKSEDLANVAAPDV
jgi:hypothetical protein